MWRGASGGSGGASGAASITSGTITGVTINNSVIGGTTPAAGTFTQVTVSGGAAGLATLYLGGANQPYISANSVAQMRWINAFGAVSQYAALETTIGSATGTSMMTPGANSVLYASIAGSLAAGAATSRTEINKAVTAIADNVAKATFTVTIPNAAHSAMLSVTLNGSLGAGGAIGANEASGTVTYDISVARTLGVNAVAVASVAYGAATASVAGAAVMTITAAVSAISGAVGATNTFTVDVTIHAVTGSSTNHTCNCYARLQNANGTGVTIA